MDGRRNYFLGNRAFSAIRIPEAGTLAKKQGLDEALALRLERAALDTLRAYAQEQAEFAETLEAVLTYAELSREVSRRTRLDYIETLTQKPWTYCECAICQKVDVEVMIFRGNNRNRRRGFHNTWQLYRQLRGEPQRQPPVVDDAQLMSLQLSLAL